MYFHQLSNQKVWEKSLGVETDLSRIKSKIIVKDQIEEQEGKNLEKNQIWTTCESSLSK